jgi:SAM-dependent methyltransferase
MKTKHNCRLCGSNKLSAVLKLKSLPVSHALRTSTADPDPRFDLGFATCARCGFLQVPDPVPAEVLYTDTDTYTTGFHKPRHLDDLITTAIAQQDPGSVIDIGCNDGALMDALKRHGYSPIVGVEPITVAANEAIKKGYQVYTDFLTPGLAKKLKKEHGTFDTAYLRHVAEHIYDLDEFFQSIRALLRDNGLLIMELPQVEPGLTRGNPAILWEEHVNYLLEPLAAYLLEKFGFTILDKRHYAFGGGAIAFIARKERTAPARLSPPKAEPSLRLVRDFKKKMKSYVADLAKCVQKARKNGYQVSVYGAAPRSCVVAAASNISGLIDLVIDDRADIQGRLMPGTERKIQPVTEIDADGPPMLCLLGVGSENEFKVRAKLTAHLHQPPVYISLFPPRDTLASIAAASKKISAR